MIHILDALAVEPGNLQEVHRRVRESYQPAVATLNMALVQVWIAPAVELVERPTELLLLWELPDVPAYWRMKSACARNPEVLAFWTNVAPLLAGRTRRLMCDPDDESVLR